MSTKTPLIYPETTVHPSVRALSNYTSSHGRWLVYRATPGKWTNERIARSDVIYDGITYSSSLPAPSVSQTSPTNPVSRSIDGFDGWEVMTWQEGTGVSGSQAISADCGHCSTLIKTNMAICQWSVMWRGDGLWMGWLQHHLVSRSARRIGEDLSLVFL